MNENKFFIWEEKNLTEPKKNLENKNESETFDTIQNTGIEYEKEISNDITKKWERKCPNCNKIIYHTNKYNRNQAVSKNRLCPSCKQLKNKRGNKNPYEWMLSVIRHVSRRNKIGFSLTYDDILKFIKIEKCHYCNSPINWIKHKSKFNKNKSQSYNLDRVDNNKSYCFNNLVVCCKRCNYLKSSKINYRTMIEIGKILNKNEN